MLWTLFVIFFILWALGLGGVFAIGAWVWLLCAIWVICLIAAFSTRRAGPATTSRV